MHPDNSFARSISPVLILMTMVFFVVMPRFLLSPLLLRIGDSFAVDYGTASTLFLSASFGFVAGLLTSGFVAKRLTHRWTIVFSIGATGVSLIALTAVANLWAFHVLLVICSWATGLYPGSGVSSVASAVPDRHRGKALALHESGPNLAFIVAPIISALLAPLVGWTGVFAAVGACAIGCALVFARFGTASTDPARSISYSDARLLGRNKSFWVIVILLMVAAVGAIGIYSVLPTFLMTEHGYSERFVNNFVGVSRIAGFVAIFAAGAFTDRFGFSAVAAAIVGVTGVLTLLIGVTTGTALLAAVFLQPLLVQSFFPVGINGLTIVVPPELRNVAVSLAIPLANVVGTGLAPRALGAAGAAGRFGAGFVVVGIATISGIALLPLLRGGPLARRRHML